MAGYMATAKRQDWETPQALFDFLNNILHFTVDLACTEGNKKLLQAFTVEKDSLKQEWAGRGWLNPPYGNGLSQWIQKAYESVEQGEAEFIACLIPAATETSFWFKYCWNARYILFLKGRLNFEINGIRSKNCQTKGSALVVFSKSDIPWIHRLEEIGKLVKLKRGRLDDILDSLPVEKRKAS